MVAGEKERCKKAQVYALVAALCSSHMSRNSYLRWALVKHLHTSSSSRQRVYRCVGDAH